MEPKTILATRSASGAWYVDGVPHMFPMMNFLTSIPTPPGDYYLLIADGVVREIVPVQ